MQEFIGRSIIMRTNDLRRVTSAWLYALQSVLEWTVSSIEDLGGYTFMKHTTIHVSRICCADIVPSHISTAVETTYLETVDGIYSRWNIL